ncbi:MAG: type II toxin-antitoxin system VapC family toxin [Brasilonema octagenarum HA4186-MV1]|nr:type II toxin-antitoxin system VapC family toxin [Brasilonema octagenarum HA4186-MV1]
MKYLFDTDHISFIQRSSSQEYANIAAKIAKHSPADFAFSIVSLHEQVLGANAFINRAQISADTIRGYAILLEILQGFSIAPVLSFDAASATIFERLRAERVRIATMDLRIASIALSRNLVLLTRNSRDFSQVPGLVTEDWTV